MSDARRPSPRRPRRRRPPSVPGEFGDPVPLRDALADVGMELGLGDPTVTAALSGGWAEVVGEVVAQHSRPRSLRGGVLTIAVDESPWATELRYQEDSIRARVAVVTGVDVVTSVRVVVEPFPDTPPNP